MKYGLIPFLFIFIIGCGSKTDKTGVSKLSTFQDTTSYVLGADIGENLKRQQIEIDFDVFMGGFTDGYETGAVQLDNNQRRSAMMGLQKYIKEKLQEAEKNNLLAADDFLEKNKTENSDIKETPTGLQYRVLQEGEGTSPGKTDQVKVHYTGTLEDGTKFDSSRDRNQPFEFPLGVGRVIKGWDEGISTMKPSGKRKLIIPSELGYGSRSAGKIPPNSTLIFEVELIEVMEAFVDTDFLLPGREEVTDSGLRMIVHNKGSGEKPTTGQTVSIHYTGLLETGSKFDSSHDRGKPFSFQLGQGRVIKGWDEAIALMSKGEKRTLIIPPDIGYGSRAMGKIPPNSTLIFEVELIDFK